MNNNNYSNDVGSAFFNHLAITFFPHAFATFHVSHFILSDRKVRRVTLKNQTERLSQFDCSELAANSWPGNYESSSQVVFLSTL